ncbi:DUF6297 family protein [Williamsia sp. SKLECPSW1]
MTRDDLPGVVLAAVIGAGLLWNLLGPGFLGGAIVVGTTHPVLAVGAWAAAAAILVVGAPVWWWGPIRVSTARARWELSGPADRGPALRRALLHTAGVAMAAGAVTGLTIGALTRADVHDVSVAIACAATSLATTAVLATALLAQTTRSHRATGGRSMRLGRLHRAVVAPRDGLAAATRLMLLTGDTEFIERAHRIRWSAAHVRARSRPLASTAPVVAMVRADLIRLTRRRGDLAAWITVAALTIGLGASTTMPVIGPAVATLLGYRAGSSTASGLRTVAMSPGVGRALGVSPVSVTVAHGVVPTIAVLAWFVVAGLAMPGIASACWPVILVGTVVAVLRRASRPEPPWDAPAYVTGQGGVVQPLLLAALVRGHLAVAVTAVLACLVA